MDRQFLNGHDTAARLDQKAKATWPIPDGVRVHDLGGYPLAYQDAGDGETLLLVHGSLNDYRAWAGQVEALSSRFRCIAPSLRHCYPEPWDGKDTDFTVEQHAADLARLIEERGVAPVHLVGHSRGGAVSITLARQHPHLVRTLTLADPAGLEGLLPDTPEGRRWAVESMAMFARLRGDLADGDTDAAARNFVDTLGGKGAWDRRTPAQKQPLLDNLATGPACAQRPRFVAADIAALNMPVLLITGATSPRRYAAMLEAMRALLSDPPAIVTIPAAAHAMNRENPTAFNAALLEFLLGQGRPLH